MLWYISLSALYANAQRIHSLYLLELTSMTAQLHATCHIKINAFHYFGACNCIGNLYETYRSKAKFRKLILKHFRLADHFSYRPQPCCLHCLVGQEIISPRYIFPVERFPPSPAQECIIKQYCVMGLFGSG